MHPAPSVILFTTLSGAGFGFLFFLNLGLAGGAGLGVWPAYALAVVLATSGLVASTFHLGNPRRALLAFSQWRTSWLSREGWFSLGALLLSLPVALSRVGGTTFSLPGLAAAALCLATVIATAMIYAQLTTVPRWNHWTVPLGFLAFATTGGMILGPGGWLAGLICLILGAVMILSFWQGDRRFAVRGQTINAATGLEGAVRPFAPPHTGGNYVMSEMIHRVGRKHAQKLRLVAVTAASLIPALVLFVLPTGPVAGLLAFAVHLAGALAQRWLFFAEAEHVVAHYYGRG